MREYPISVLDVFAERPLAGNQLAVVHDAADLTDEQMQAEWERLMYPELFALLASSRDVVIKDLEPLRTRVLSAAQAHALHDGIGPSLEVAEALLGHPQQLGDHRDRQRDGEVAHEVHFIAAFHRVEAVARNLSDARLQRGDPPRGEAAVDEMT